MILQSVAAPYPSSSMDYHLFDAIKNEFVIVMTNLSNILEYRMIVDSWKQHIKFRSGPTSESAPKPTSLLNSRSEDVDLNVKTYSDIDH